MDIKEAKESLNKILEHWKTIKDIEDPILREIEENLYMEEMPFVQIQTVLSELENSIPKSKIEDKIKEYREKRNELARHFYDRAENTEEDRVLFIAGETLKELLKGE